VLAGALVLGSPFFLSANGGAIKGILPTEPYFLAAGSGGSINTEASYLPFQHFLLFWTPLMLPAAVFVCWCLARRNWDGLRDYGALAFGAVVVLPLVWAIAVLARHGTSGLGDELRVRGWGWLTAITLGIMLAASLAALLAELFGEEKDGRPVLIFLTACVVVGVLLVYGPEFFMVSEATGTRANTTFKLWYSSWMLLSVAGGVGGAWALWRTRSSAPSAATLRRVAAGACAVVLLGALVYPLYAPFSRTNGFTGSRTLDGEAYLRTSDPDLIGAAGWLERNLPGVATILEATGDSYSEAGRVSALTGLPSVLGWQFDEVQERGSSAEVERRAADIKTIYTTADPGEAFRLLQRYGVQYVVVGRLERQMYGAAGMAKFGDMGTPVYSSPSMVIYRVGRPAMFGAAG
jgi:uncharacterized membrane protein